MAEKSAISMFWCMVLVHSNRKIVVPFFPFPQDIGSTIKTQ
jgi:hypothetical protein